MSYHFVSCTSSPVEGGGILGSLLLEHVCVGAVELADYPRQILLQRQRDGSLPWFPVWDDVRTFDGRPWRGKVDVVAGGFPCQDISAAGRGAGITGLRSGLWKEFARIIREVAPTYVFVENSPLLRRRGLDVVLGDLSALGFNAEWDVFSAAAVGAPHLRKRLWILGRRANVPHSLCKGQQGLWQECELQSHHPQARRSRWWRTEPRLDRVVYGMARRVDRIAILGNGQVPAVVVQAWRILMSRLLAQ